MIGKAVFCLALMALPCEAQTDSCAQDMIISVSSDGDVLTMASGDVFEVLAGQEVESMLWLPQSYVLICGTPVASGGRSSVLYEIVNVDEHDEKVSARKLE